jgi:DNA-binding XRE family transcriptional regulator
MTMPASHPAAVQPDQFATLGELLKYLRLRAGLTQRELSIAVGYSESQISRLEQNQRLPEAAILRARFVPALRLETEPQWAARADSGRYPRLSSLISRKCMGPRPCAARSWPHAFPGFLPGS